MAVAALIGLAAGVGLRSGGAGPTFNAVPVLPDTPQIPGGRLPDVTGRSPASSGSSSTTGASVDAAAVATKVNPAVVDINTVLGYQGGAGAGTGMVLTSNGEILTNNHVVDGATAITVRLVDTGRTFKATVVGTAPTEDVAVLQLQGASGLKTMQAGDSSAVAVGDPVVAIGNAGGTGGAPAVVTGTVESVHQTITATDQGGGSAETLNDLIQTNAPIQPGDSGGPLANAAGQVIGMDTAASANGRFRSGRSVGFAIPIARAVSVAKQIESGHASATIHIGLPGFLGVSVDPAGSQGALVASVHRGSPAEAAGLVAGDTITSVGGTTIGSSSQLSAATRSHRPGDRVNVGWTDQAGARHTAGVTLAAGPAD